MIEKRRSPRVATGIRVQFALHRRNRELDFQEAQARDISDHGIAFFCDQELLPASSLVLKLGDDLAIKVSARVVRCEPSDDEHLVACEFTQRL